MPTTRIGLLAFPRMTQLDLTGPYEVFANLPGAEVRLLWKTLDPVAAASGMRLIPDTTLADCPQLDVLCVPGGPGIDLLMEDEAVLSFLRRQSEGVRIMSSVCTGAMVLGAAGLLRGKRATTHWASWDLLASLGAIPTRGRVVRDGNLFTGGGVTAGIDFALTVVAELAGAAVAQTIQLGIEYAPAPPFDAGTPETAPPEILRSARTRLSRRQAMRQELVARVAARLGSGAGPRQ